MSESKNSMNSVVQFTKNYSDEPIQKPPCVVLNQIEIWLQLKREIDMQLFMFASAYWAGIKNYWLVSSFFIFQIHFHIGALLKPTLTSQVQSHGTQFYNGGKLLTNDLDSSLVNLMGSESFSHLIYFVSMAI